MTNSEFQLHTRRVDELLHRVSALTDSEARTSALELVQAIMDLHGATVSRLVELLEDASETGRNLLARLASDPMICGLLVLYGIHPVPLEQRVEQAVEKLVPQLRKSGTSVQVLGIKDGVVRLDLEKEARGFRYSPEKIHATIEQAILEAAPEVVEILIDGLTSSFVPIEMIQPAIKKGKTYEESAA
jgi:Fe-S cluster biogenesis protein NfuA